jgi:ATP-dependent phosphofructokinase / diphosphate-dependent phosphofructokinase
MGDVCQNEAPTGENPSWDYSSRLESQTQLVSVAQRQNASNAKGYAMKKIRRIGILTGGGDAPGLNAVIRAVTKSAILQHGWGVTGFRNGFEGCISGEFEELNLASVRGILPRGGTILGASNRCNPFSYQYSAAGEQMPRDHSGDVIKRFEELGIDAIVVIGGDGTMSISHELSKRGVQVIGIPKTIDNDVRGTKVTFGFDTAVSTATWAIDKLHTTAESHHRVMIVELMGRTAGWITLYAGVAGGADIILIPELPFDINSICEKIQRRSRLGTYFTIIAVAEGAQPVDGTAIYQTIGEEWYQKRFGGIAAWLEAELTQRLDQEVRSVVLGHLQRGGEPTARDRALGTMMGTFAIDLLASGETDRMVSISRDPMGQSSTDMMSVPLVVATRGPRHVPLSHPLLRSAEMMDINVGASVTNSNGDSG